MKKILLITMLLVLVAVPAFAGGINFSTFAVSATSKAGVSSMSFGNSGSGAAALNTSYAGVSFSGKDVSTLATTAGYTGGYGINIASQSGTAYAAGFKTGWGW